MPTIYDNIENQLASALKESFALAYKADICVGYFNLRGWNQLAGYVDTFSGGEDNQCRLIVGMQTQPQELIQRYYSHTDNTIDHKTALLLKRQLAEEFRSQLTLGIPSSNDEKTLNQLAQQLKDEKLVVKLFVEYSLHAKLYLIHRLDKFNPVLSYLGSSNLTLAGLGKQGELNIDVPDKDAAEKLCDWFKDRWETRYCLDISAELIAIIEEGWAKPKLPYYIYLKMAYHLSQEARAGLTEFKLPVIFTQELLDFQQKAVLIAAEYLNKRGGVLIGDVVGLGKTMTATALAKLFEDDFYLETLIICPKNLTGMWEDYVHRYRLHAKVLSISKAKDLRDLRRYRLVIIDESHNLRNNEGKHYKIIEEYIKRNNSKVILLSATPYNKGYKDLAGQLGLFIDEQQDLGISPECYMKQIGGQHEFTAKYQVSPRSLAAFAKSDYADDWRELMRLYLVRRTRGFIKKNYAQEDTEKNRHYLTFANGSRLYFPERHAKKVEYPFDEHDKTDPYALLYSAKVVGFIDKLLLPRYGLGEYLLEQPPRLPSGDEQKIIENLTRSGQRLKGFARTNLFKRLESGGHAFLLSLYRHIMRNYVYIYALQNNLEIPIGQQESRLLDSLLSDDDTEQGAAGDFNFHGDTKKYIEDAKNIYQSLERAKFTWIGSDLFKKSLKAALTEDSVNLNQILKLTPTWQADKDRKLQALYELVTVKHSTEKLLIFTQFSDTAQYLAQQLMLKGVESIACVTGQHENPTVIAQRFSPKSNDKNIAETDEIRVLITTDVLSEGQNLQDAHIVVNYDLPWAIIRLIQRAGRVDRIGQQADSILCYSFLPEEGIENIIALRDRLMQRIEQNADVMGSDERFFEGDPVSIHDLYSENSSILEEQDDEEVDLSSYSFQIWKNATDANPALKTIIPNLPNVVYSSKASEQKNQAGVIVYAKTPLNNDVLTWLNDKGDMITQSQFTILKAAACSLETPIIPRVDHHHELVAQAIGHIKEADPKIGGQLGKANGARYQVYQRLNRHYALNKNSLFENQELKKAIDELYQYPLQEYAKDVISRQLKLSLDDEALSELVLGLREENKCCQIEIKLSDNQEPSVICSLGIVFTDNQV
jgi:superfamily II DNA or RNA helicase